MINKSKLLEDIYEGISDNKMSGVLKKKSTSRLSVENCSITDNDF